LRHVVDALDLDIFEVGPVRGLITETMGQVIEFQPHAVFKVLFKHHAANSFGHGILPCCLRPFRKPFTFRDRAAGSRVGACCRIISEMPPGQAAAEFMLLSNAFLVARSRSAISAWRFANRWLGTGTEIATA